MKKFRFSMESILRVNQTRKELAMSEMAEATQKYENEQKKLIRIENELMEQLNQRAVPGEHSASYLLQKEKYLKLLRDRRLFQYKNLEAAGKVLERSKEKLKKAFIEVKKMDMACERQKKNWMTESNREEQAVNDEIGTNRYFFG